MNINIRGRFEERSGDEIEARLASLRVVLRSTIPDSICDDAT